MKTSKYPVLKTIALCVVLLAAARTGKAQIFPNSYINVDWQMGVPLGSSLADKASGWGMNFEGGYFITPAIVHLVPDQPRNDSAPDTRPGQRFGPHGQPEALRIPAAVRRHQPLHLAYGQRIPALCRPEAGSQLRRTFVLLLRRQAVQRHVGILPLARNRREHLPAPRLPFRVPCGTLLQLCHQQRRRPDLLGQQPQ